MNPQAKKAIYAMKLLWAQRPFAAVVYAFNLCLTLLSAPVRFYWIRGQWYIIQDRGIATLVIYKEIVLGYYDAKLRKGAKVLDVGAHVGLFSIPLARENPTVKFRCFEPDAINYANLCRNVKRNRAKNIEPIRMAVGPAGMVDTIHDNWNTGLSHTLPGYSVPCVPLRDLGPCDLLKIDIEGGEYAAIRQPSDWALADQMIIEIHSHADQKKMEQLCAGARIILEVP